MIGKLICTLPDSTVCQHVQQSPAFPDLNYCPTCDKKLTVLGRFSDMYCLVVMHFYILFCRNAF